MNARPKSQISSWAAVIGIAIQFLVVLGTVMLGFFQVDKRLAVIEAKFDLLSAQQATYATKADVNVVQSQYRVLEDRVQFLERTATVEAAKGGR